VRGQDDLEEEEEEDSEEQRIPHLAASKVCINWLHQQSEGESSQILLLQRLQHIAHYKYSNSLRQTTVTDFTD